MKIFLMAATAAVALAGAATPAEAAKLLYRSYNNQGVLHGAMVFDTSKPYTVNGAETVIIPTFAVSKLIFSPTSGSDSGSVKSGASFYEPLVGFYGSDAFGRGNTIAISNLPPTDAKLFQNVAGPGTTPVFNTGTYGIYRNVDGQTFQDSTYTQLGSVVVTDVTNTAVNIFAMTNDANTQLEWLAVAFGDQPETAPLANGGFRLTNFEGAIFDTLNGSKLTNIEFGSRTITAGSSLARTILPYFDGPNTAPEIFKTADATTSYSNPRFAGYGTENNKRFYRAFTSAEALAGAVPEPGTWALMIIGIGMTGAAMRRRTRVTLVYR